MTHVVFQGEPGLERTLQDKLWEKKCGVSSGSIFRGLHETYTCKTEKIPLIVNLLWLRLLKNEPIKPIRGHAPLELSGKKKMPCVAAVSGKGKGRPSLKRRRRSLK